MNIQIFPKNKDFKNMQIYALKNLEEFCKKNRISKNFGKVLIEKKYLLKKKAISALIE